MHYIHHTNNIIDEGPRNLPKAWRNISGPDLLGAAELKKIGWLPVRYTDEAYDPAIQARTGPTGCNIGDAVPADAVEVVGAYAVRVKTLAEIDGEKDGEAQAELDRKFIAAVVKWAAPLVGKTAAEAKAEIKAIYKALL